MQKNTLNSICIVGGGTAGWMAASLLSSALQGSHIKITLIESPDIATIGVGESTVPSMMEFLRVCRINLKEFVEATSATFKLGIRFDDWLKPGEQYFHPFGRVGQDINGFAFYQAWLKNSVDGYGTRWVDHSPSAIMAEHQRFMLRPSQQQNWVLRSYGYALHLDAILVARYLRDFSQGCGVERIEATVDKVVIDERQFIHTLALNNGITITSDFFIDCTGFKGLLIEEALKVGYEDWTHYLPCNRAVAVQTTNAGTLPPFTIATAREAGWTWRIPLQHRTGNGYVYSSQYCSDDQAIHTLLTAVEGELLIEPRVIPFATGRRKKIWHNNCLALGLAAGFLEPLESTAIHLIYKTLVHFIRYFPDQDFEVYTEQAFNQKINIDYQEIRDFIILHYCTTGRDDTEFWRWCQGMPVPDSLQEKICLFRARGQIEHTPDQFFSQDSWCSILEGMKVRPKKYHPLMDAFDGQGLASTLQESAQSVYETVMQMPMHGDYIQQHCAAKKMM
ncbi:tryptophan halogenase family protein [Cellvibrio japonicus]|nr:tryptophan halogenase family protein [Cellvibrio japonicus]QEI11067.1 tryptophan 7-halogenase [Cellvibrio japonicus]QEI14642.1 tryptophan 7-halogenase [Cellvibrio japonicus]QEI18221.1 tryptophan 7-halogenase [Cellvibrio japonicus]